MPEKTKDKRALKKQALLNSLLMMLFAGLIIFLGTVSWFTMSREVDGTGARMTAQDGSYSLTTVGTVDGLYYGKYHSKVIDPDAVVWQMNPDATSGMNQNFGNGTAKANPIEDGIYPGCRGYISFQITPKVESSLPLKFTFEMLGYNANETGDEVSMIPLDETEDADIISYLNGHILFFTNYDPATGKYSGLIQPGEDMARVLERTFSGKGTATQVDIYWVWPLTLSMLVKPENDNTATLCTGNGYTELENFVVAHPQYFMKGVTTSAENPLTAANIKANYDLYGGRYDQADNIIGARVRYLRLVMTVS